MWYIRPVFTRACLLLGVTSLLAGCAVRHPVVAPAEFHSGHGYSYVTVDNKTYLVLVKNDRDLPIARHEIGCPCIEDLVGKVYQLIPAKGKK